MGIINRNASPSFLAPHTCSRCGAEFIGEALARICHGCRAKTKAVKHHLRGSGLLMAGRPLTQREMMVMRLLCVGLSSKEIGARLHITEGTVKVYVSCMFDKTGKSTRTELVAWAKCKYFCPREGSADGPHGPVKCDPPRDGADTYVECA